MANQKDTNIEDVKIVELRLIEDFGKTHKAGDVVLLNEPHPVWFPSEDADDKREVYVATINGKLGFPGIEIVEMFNVSNGPVAVA